MYGEAAKERVSFRFASAADIERYYGASQPQSLRAIVIILGGEVCGVLGVARAIDHVRFFSEFREELRPHLRALPVMRAIKAAQRLIEESRLPVYARAEETEKDAARILTRLGFVHQDGDVYLWRHSQLSSPT